MPFPVAAPVCLVSMPFMPITMPALGISLLKASLARAGIGCDVFYGSLRLLSLFETIGGPETALIDYSLIATVRQCGDLLFARSFWSRAGPSEDSLRPFLDEVAASHPSGLAVDTLARISAAEARAPDFLEGCFASRDWSRSRIVGFSSTFAQQIASLWLARRIKTAHPEVTIVFGGANCDGDMGPALLEHFPFIDHLVQGEADHPFPILASRLLAGELLDAVPGLLSRSGSIIVRGAPAEPVRDLAALPIPDYTDFFQQRPAALALDDVTLPIETSRGCWWGAKSHCVFCGLNPSTMAFRSKPPARAIAEIDALAATWPIRRMAAVDNILDISYFETVLPKLRDRGISFFYETKSNLKEWQVARLAEAGVHNIQPGIEGLNSRTLGLMRKGVRRHQNLELLKWCRTYGIAPLWLYLYGLPGEDPADYVDDAHLMLRIPHLPPPKMLNPVTVDPFSPLFTARESFGVSALRVPPDVRLAYSGLGEADLERISYHFDSRIEGLSTEQYLPQLGAALGRWQDGYRRGAALVRFVGDTVTLVIDARRPDDHRAHLLSGPAHRVFSAMHTATATTRLAKVLTAAARDDDTMSARDLELSLAGVRHGAELHIVDPGNGFAGLEAFLAAVEAADLAIPCDELWLALPTDILDLAEADALGSTALAILCAPTIPRPLLNRGVCL